MTPKKSVKKKTAKNKKKTSKKKTVHRRYMERTIKVIAVSKPEDVELHIPDSHELERTEALGVLKGKIWLEISTLPVR